MPPGFLRRRGSTSASSSSVASPSTSVSVAGSLPSSASSNHANYSNPFAYSHPQSARSQRKAAEAAWFQQVGQLRLSPGNGALANPTSAGTPLTSSHATHAAPSGRGAKPNLVAAKAQQALQSKPPHSPPFAYRPLPPFQPSSPSSKTKAGRDVVGKKSSASPRGNSSKKKKAANWSDVFVVPAAAQVIDHTRATQRVMRSISGLGMEDPVGKYEDDDGGEADGQQGATEGAASASHPSPESHRSHYYSSSRKPQHPSIIFEDMSLGAVPRDMQDLVTVASDPTANTKKGLDWAVWNDSLKNFDPETFAAVPPVPVFVSKQKKKKAGAAPSEPKEPPKPASVLLTRARTSPEAIAKSANDAEALTISNLYKYSPAPTPAPSSPTRSRSRPSPLASPTSPAMSSSDSAQQPHPIAPPPLSTDSPKTSPKRRGKKRHSLTSMMQDDTAQAAATHRAMGKSIQSLESLTLEDVFPGATFSRQASSKESLQPPNLPPSTSHRRRRSCNSSQSINRVGHSSLEDAVAAAPSSQSNLSRQQSSSNRMSVPSSSFSASSSNLLIAEAALALQLESSGHNAQNPNNDPTVARSNQLIASALAAAVVSASSQLQRAGSVPDLKLRQLQSSAGSSCSGTRLPQSHGRPASSHRNVVRGSSSRLSERDLFQSFSKPEQAHPAPTVPDLEDDEAVDALIEDEEEEDDELSDTRIEQLGKTSLHSTALSTQSDMTDLILLGDDEENFDDDHVVDEEVEGDNLNRERGNSESEWSEEDGETVEVVIMLVDGDDDTDDNNEEREIQAVVNKDGVITFSNSWENLSNGSSYNEVHMALEVDAPEEGVGSETAANQVLEEAISRLVREISQSHLSGSQSSSERRLGTLKVPASPLPNQSTQRRGSATSGSVRRGSFQYPASPGIDKATNTSSPGVPPHPITATAVLRRSTTDWFPNPPSPVAANEAVAEVEDTRRSSNNGQRRGSSSSQPASMASDIVSSTRTPRSLDTSANGSFSQVSSSSHSRSNHHHYEAIAFPPPVSVTPEGVFVSGPRTPAPYDPHDEPQTPGRQEAPRRSRRSTSATKDPQQKHRLETRRATSSSTLQSTRSSWRSSLWVIADDPEGDTGAGDRTHAAMADGGDSHTDPLRPSQEKRALPVSMASIFPDDH